jgi:hypothetical protein
MGGNGTGRDEFWGRGRLRIDPHPRFRTGSDEYDLVMCVGIARDWQMKPWHATVLGNFHIATSQGIIHFASVPLMGFATLFDL